MTGKLGKINVEGRSGKEEAARVRDRPVFAVLGAGNGGVATAADLTVRGFRVRLFELPEFGAALDPIRAAGGIALEVLPSSGLTPGFAKPEMVITDIREALAGADAVLVIVPSFAHSRFARLLAPEVTPGQAVVVSPGNFGGALEFALAFRELGRRDVLVAETESMIYACRKKDGATVWIRGYKRALRVAALPSGRTPAVLELLRAAYPEMEAAANVLETGISNPNCFEHVPLMLMNVGLIESTEGDFLFYHEGLTPGVGRVIDAIDRERMALAGALGLPSVRSLRDQEIAWYAHQGVSGDNVYETSSRNPIYRWSKAPPSLESRYLTEDVPYGLVPVEALARRLGVQTRIISAMIDLASTVLERDFRTQGRTLESLGVDFGSVEELRKLVDEAGV